MSRRSSTSTRPVIRPTARTARRRSSASSSDAGAASARPRHSRHSSRASRWRSRVKAGLSPSRGPLDHRLGQRAPAGRRDPRRCARRWQRSAGRTAPSLGGWLEEIALVDREQGVFIGQAGELWLLYVDSRTASIINILISASPARAFARLTPSDFDLVPAVAQTGRVGHSHGIAGEIELDLDDVTGGAGRGRHDGRRTSC